MTPAQDIQANLSASFQRSVSNSWGQNLSGSPTATFNSPPSSWGGPIPRRSAPKSLKPFNTQDIKILLLENVNVGGQEILRSQGYQVEALKTSLPEDQLIEKIRCVHPRCVPRHDRVIFLPLVAKQCPSPSSFLSLVN